jgi:hypothetical protein
MGADGQQDFIVVRDERTVGQGQKIGPSVTLLHIMEEPLQCSLAAAEQAQGRVDQ